MRISSALYGLLCLAGIAAAQDSPPDLGRDREAVSYCGYDLGLRVGIRAINNRNQIVGGTAVGNASRAFLWDWQGGMRLLGVLPGAYGSWATDINDRGEVVGVSGGNAVPLTSFIWDRRRGMRAVPTLGGTQSEATHINNSGQIVGTAFTPDPEAGPHVYFRELNGEVVDLGFGFPFGVTDRGVVGFQVQSQTSLESTIFFWDSRNGLQRLGGFPEASLAIPDALNNRGELVGAIEEQGARAIRWTQREGMQLLDVFGEGASASSALSINRWGTIVGFGPDQFDNTTALIWQKHAGVGDLNQMFHPTSPVTYQNAELLWAIAVNDQAWIAATGYFRSTPPENRHAFVLVPKFPGDTSPCPAPPVVSTN